MKITRADILRLGRIGNPWGFLPLALRALDLAPHDHGMRLLLAANFAQLGLRALAEQTLDLLPAEARAEPDAARLDAALALLPAHDTTDPESRIARARGGLAALEQRHPAEAAALRAEVEPWAHATRDAHARGDGPWRTRDGQLISRITTPHGPTAWRGLMDARRIARAVYSQALGRHGPTERPIVVEGADPCCFAIEALRQTTANKVGYAPRITLIDADPHRALDALADPDFEPLLAEPRVELFLGPGAVQRLDHAMRARRGAHAAATLVPVPGARPAANPSVAEVITSWDAEQHTEQDRLITSARALDATHDTRWWARRYDDAARGEPLRVLIPTTIHSTYVGRASEGLARAMKRLGHDARVVREPDRWTRPAPLALLDAMDGWTPDMVVLINYPRESAYPGVFPPGIPFVCWVQDAMPHLFDPASGARTGDRDFLAGHLHESAVRALAVPERRRLSMPVVADDGTPDDLPPNEALRRALACDLLVVTHHAETPEAMRERLAAELADDDGRRAVEMVWQRVEQALSSGAGAMPAKAARSIAQDVAHQVWGDDAPPTAIDILRHQVAAPLIDRAWRHQTIRWAVGLCARRGWTIALHGRGWHRHPEFAPFARGELTQGDELRAAYHAAAVTLHVSAGGLVHQRVLEATLSGGLPACRVCAESFAPLLARARAQLLDHGAAPRGRNRFGLLYDTHDGPLASAWADALQALGLERPARVVMPDRLGGVAPRLPEAEDPTWILGDLTGPEALGFADATGLEAIIERARRDATWRARRSAAIAQRVRQRLTTTVLARRLIALVGNELRRQELDCRRAAA